MADPDSVPTADGAGMPGEESGDASGLTANGAIGPAASTSVLDSSSADQAQHALELLSGMVAVIEQTPIAAVRSFDRDGVVRFWNRTCSTLYGLAADQALAQPMDQVLSHGDAEAEYRARVAEVWASGRPCPSRDWLVRSAAGKELWIYSTMFPVFRGGQLQQIFCMDVDITARKADESALMQISGNFRQLFTTSADAILLIRDQRIAEVNPAAVALFQCGDAQRLIGRHLADFSPLQQDGGDVSGQADLDMAERARAQGNCRYDWRYVTCTGELFWAEVLLTAIAVDHQELFYAVIRDISERKQAELSLYLAAQVFENTRDAVLVTDRQRRIVSINRAYSEITGFTDAEMAGRKIGVYRDGDEDPALYQRIWDEVAAAGHWQGEIGGLRKNLTPYPAWLSVTVIRDRNGEIANYMGILTDIADRKKSEAQTRHLAEHDFLTDLPNRVLLLDRLSQALMAARRKHSMLAILFLDLDHFKNINDTMGHHVGDLLLKEVARRLIRCVRGVDTVSRQGGDEFVIILADIGGVDQAAHVASTVLHAVSQVYQIGGYELHVSTSVGVSVFPSDGEDIDTLVKNADIAMYHVKEGGRNGFQFFDAEMNAHIVERVGLENGLRQALDREEFLLEFQPEIDIGNGQVVGAEALLRWRHPERGLLQPKRFIDVAEDAGLMIPIGNWVLRQACGQARRWMDAGQPLVVAVNLSTGQFLQKNLVQHVRDALDGARLPAAYLELELTEAVLMNGGNKVAERLQALRELGLRLTIDDFGTGYSRLSQLRSYPFDKLKIDQSFMADINGDPDDAGIVSAIIAMAKNLKIRVIAEGVETAGQLQFLRSRGCDEYQGYYSSTALRGSAIAGLSGLAGAGLPAS